MTSLTIELSDQDYLRLEKAAAAEQISVAELLTRIACQEAEALGDSEAGAAAARRHMRTFPDVFKRLAE